MQIPFPSLPADARLWIFAAARPLTDAEQQRLLGLVDAFLDRWTAHNHPLTSARELRYGQFLFVAVDESSAGASGCSIDAMVRSMTRSNRNWVSSSSITVRCSIARTDRSCVTIARRSPNARVAAKCLQRRRVQQHADPRG